MAMAAFNLDAVRSLAAMAPRFRGTPDQPMADLQSVKDLLIVARSHTSQSRAEFEQRLRKSNKYLFPLGEPLAALDFREHRWVANGREEAYSDWLQWIVARLAACDILDVFGAHSEHVPSNCKVKVRREVHVQHGHTDHTGRLDLKVEFDGKTALVVEVKLGEAEHADTSKGKG
jgi:hypothetical protein